MKVVIVCGGTLGEAFDMLREAFINTSKQVEEFNELIKCCFIDEEEMECMKCTNFPRTVVKIMKSQVLNRKPMLIRARTTC
ncbi:TPA: hypothetical protein QCX47_003061 [Bacillus mycoides]|nr:hypothetical protein [Bacillus mycoides]